MKSNFNLPPGVTSRDIEGEKQDKCQECGETVDDCQCNELAPCYGVEFDEDTRICPNCGEHV